MHGLLFMPNHFRCDFQLKSFPTEWLQFWTIRYDLQMALLVKYKIKISINLIMEMEPQCWFVYLVMLKNNIKFKCA